MVRHVALSLCVLCVVMLAGGTARAASQPASRLLQYRASDGWWRTIRVYDALDDDAPLVVLLGGTGIDATDTNHPFPTTPPTIRALYDHGFRVASVAYPNGIFDGFDCTALMRKARAIFDPANSYSAVSVLRRDLHLGATARFAVTGHSQGAWVGALAGLINPAVNAALLSAIGVQVDFFVRADLRSCLPAGARRIPHVLAITGEQDFVVQGIFPFNWSVANVRGQLRTLTGVCTRCPGNDGRLADGSGWYVVTAAETATGDAGHDFFLTIEGYLDPYWETDDLPWSLHGTMDWLAESMGL